MGLFQRKNSENHEQSSAYSEVNVQIVTKIVQLITKGEQAVISDVKRYFEADQENETGLIGFVDILEKYNYVCCRDWRDYLDDFFYFVQNLEGTKIHQLSMSREWFNEDDNIPIWCGILDMKWKSKGLCVAAIDEGSDSYILFICGISELKQLKKWSAQIGFRIDLARNL